ncbi:MAG: zinc ABC transporter substrate-binding protein [Bacteroidales bacterium]|nr:zinc ABC transporter substrate-binding protein [Bacteroidales bacterium]
MKTAFLTFGLALFLIMESCAPQKQETDKPVVTVSILPLKYFVTHLGGDMFDIQVLIPPGASPEHFEPTPRQIAMLAGSIIYFTAGTEMIEQPWMEKIIVNSPDLEMVNFADHVDTRGSDPHIWMSVSQARTMSIIIREKLSAALPSHRDFFTARLNDFMKATDTLENRIRQRLDSLRCRKFIIYHPALTSFAIDFGLEQIALEEEGKEPSPKKMLEVVERGKAEGISVVVVQKQFDTVRAGNVADEIGAALVVIDPLDENWASQLLHIADQIMLNQKQSGDHGAGN